MRLPVKQDRYLWMWGRLPKWDRKNQSNLSNFDDRFAPAKIPNYSKSKRNPAGLHSDRNILLFLSDYWIKNTCVHLTLMLSGRTRETVLDSKISPTSTWCLKLYLLLLFFYKDYESSLLITSSWKCPRKFPKIHFSRTVY